MVIARLYVEHKQIDYKIDSYGMIINSNTEMSLLRKALEKNNKEELKFSFNDDLDLWACRLLIINKNQYKGELFSFGKTKKESLKHIKLLVRDLMNDLL